MVNKWNFNNFGEKNIDSITRMLEKERQEIKENKDKEKPKVYRMINKPCCSGRVNITKESIEKCAKTLLK